MEWHLTGRTLKDFDWQLNLALSSDKLATLNQALVNVDFDISSGHEQSALKSVEMNDAELSMLISAFEKASQALQQAKN